MERLSTPPNRLLRDLAGLILVAMSAVSALAAYHSFGEGRALTTAPAAGSEEGGARVLRAEGPVTGELLAPDAYPEVHNALAFKASREYRSSESGPWMPDQRKKTVNERAAAIGIGNVPVIIGAKTTLATPTETIYREVDALSRLRIEIQRAPETAIALGPVKDGALRDGPFQSLILTDPTREAEIVQRLAASGRLKAVFLAMTIPIFGGLAILALWRWRLPGLLRTPQSA